MAKIKGIKKLNKAVSAQLAPFGISKAICTDEYSYIFTDEKVTYKLTENTLPDLWFTEFIKERFNYTVKHSFIISLLHERGHHITDDSIDDVIYEFCKTEKERIETAMENATEEEAKKLEWQYFNLPDEIMATQWAVNYAKKHPKKIKKMWNELVKELQAFYKKNLDELG